jgi:tRNA threonylcarbamoyladenosine biosynthesis protein TsaB
VYLQAISQTATLIPAQIQPQGRAVEHLKAAVSPSQRLALAGTAAPAAAEALAGYHPIRTTILHPDALWVARLGLAAPEPQGPPKPLYLRAPDARLPSRPAVA